MPVSSIAAFPPPKPDLSYARPPKSKLAQVFWRWRIWFEATFVLSMLEPWEKVLLLSIIITFCTLLFIGTYKYFPQHLLIMRGRVIYYLWGQESDEQWALWQWFEHGFWAVRRKEL